MPKAKKKEEEVVEEVAQEATPKAKDFADSMPATGKWELVSNGKQMRAYNERGQAVSPITSEGGAEGRALAKAVARANALNATRIAK